MTHAYQMGVGLEADPPSMGKYWFPCWDKPWDKAERGCEVNITVPDSFQTCANGVLDSVTTGDGEKTYWWSHRYAETQTTSADRLAPAVRAVVRTLSGHGRVRLEFRRVSWDGEAGVIMYGHKAVPDLG